MDINIEAERKVFDAEVARIMSGGESLPWSAFDGWMLAKSTVLAAQQEPVAIVEFIEHGKHHGKYIRLLTGLPNGTRLYTAAPAASFQDRVQPWMQACFGPVIASDREERNHRFLEESLELVQACGATASEAHQLVDYVYGRPVGEKRQEVGGVMVTLAALCLANDMDMHDAGETELTRIWGKVEQIRAKQAAKPKHSPLPEAQTRDTKIQAHPTPEGYPVEGVFGAPAAPVLSDEEIFQLVDQYWVKQSECVQDIIGFARALLAKVRT